MVKALGVDLTPVDIHNMILDLDKNQDGQIQLSEFVAWWLSGRKGMTGNMRILLSAQLTALEGLGKLNSHVQDLAKQAKIKQVQTYKNSLELTFNGGCKRPKTQFHFNA